MSGRTNAAPSDTSQGVESLHQQCFYKTKTTQAAHQHSVQNTEAWKAVSPFLLLHPCYTKEAIPSQLSSSESCVEVWPNQHNVNKHTSSQARKCCAQERSAETLRSNAVVGTPLCAVAPVEQAHHSCCEREAPNRGAFSGNRQTGDERRETGEACQSSLSTVMIIKTKKGRLSYTGRQQNRSIHEEKRLRTGGPKPFACTGTVQQRSQC